MYFYIRRNLTPNNFSKKFNNSCKNIRSLNKVCIFVISRKHKKASIFKNYGSPSVLQVKEVPKPTPNDDELLIKVHATTVNRTDCAMLRAKPDIIRLMTGLFKPKNPILGTGFAGTVEAIGKNVSRFKVSDTLFGFNDTGISSHAEYMCIQQDNFMTTIPSGFSFTQVTASIEGTHYAQNFINKIQISKTDTVLVNGATGAIGSAMIQLLVAMDIKVTATANTKNLDLVKTLGATKVIDYTKENFTELNETFNFVFDTVGKSSFGQCKRLLKKDGIYISSEIGFGGQNLFYALFTPLTGGKKVVFPYPNKHQISIDLVKKLMDEGKFKPVIDKTYSLNDIVDAFTYAESGEKTGNIVITFEDF